MARLPEMRPRPAANPVVLALAILAVCLGVTYFVAFQEQAYLLQNEIGLPDEPAWAALIYFAFGVVFIGAVLFFVPRRWLRVIMKSLFTLAYGWGVFICLAFVVPWPWSLVLAIAVAAAWLLRPTVWLHTLVMLFTMAGAAAVFGSLFSPWTFVVVMLIISVYDVLAVRFGYMVWMAQRLSESTSLPAFVIPRTASGWRNSLSTFTFQDQAEKEPAERQFSVLGGGDIAFPLVLVVSVLFNLGPMKSLVVAAFTFIGLAAAFWIQARFLKGKPMPALPPISAAAILGFLIAYYLV